MPVATGEMIYGTVRWYNLDSQSGLIDPWDDETGIGVYFDRAILRQSGLEVVADGEDVRFVAVSGDGGPTALRVELV
ncbi:cold-shock protein [Azospirillum brasilense]|nr:cold shock domain-containing protein [Azospirillum brasilense]